MKRLCLSLLIVLNIFAALSAQSSVEFAKSLTVGWNLGNTLDAFIENQTGLTSETSWGLPYTTEDMIKGIKQAGFKTIRIPVTYHNHIIDDKYTIDSSWLNRVKEIVDWVIDADLYVIINIHHDTIASSSYKNTGYVVDERYKSQSKAYLKAVWTQVAQCFINYDKHLIFELLNEPRAVGTSYEWYVPSSKQATALCNLITEYEQVCLDAIRYTGGNNKDRFLLVPGYAASSAHLSCYTLPFDSATDKLILSLHAYSPYAFAMYDRHNKDYTFDQSDMYSIDGILKDVEERFISKGIGVVLGETSAENKNNLNERIKWAKYLFGTAYNQYGIPCILWDNNQSSPDNDNSGEHHGYYNRSQNQWYFPTLMKAIMQSVGSSFNY